MSYQLLSFWLMEIKTLHFLRRSHKTKGYFVLNTLLKTTLQLETIH